MHKKLCSVVPAARMGGVRNTTRRTLPVHSQRRVASVNRIGRRTLTLPSTRPGPTTNRRNPTNHPVNSRGTLLNVRLNTLSLHFAISTAPEHRQRPVHIVSKVAAPMPDLPVTTRRRRTRRRLCTLPTLTNSRAGGTRGPHLLDVPYRPSQLHQNRIRLANSSQRRKQGVVFTAQLLVLMS